MTVDNTVNVTLDSAAVLTSLGFVAPDDAAALRERLARTEADLDALRRERPGLGPRSTR